MALVRDVVPITGDTIGPGNVQLRPDKRPRPLTLRMNIGDYLEVTFTNLLADPKVNDEQPYTRTASVHVQGVQLVDSIASDGSNVGNVVGPGGLVAPGGTATYKFYAEREHLSALQHRSHDRR